MKKILTDSDIWNKRWFQLLTPVEKCIWHYLTTRCTHAGIWEENFELMSLCINAKVNEEDLEFLGEHIIKFQKDKYFITGVPNFRCNVLNEKTTSKPALSCIDELKRYDLWKYFKDGVYTGPQDIKPFKKIEEPILKDKAQTLISGTVFPEVKNVEKSIETIGKEKRELNNIFGFEVIRTCLIEQSEIWQNDVARLCKIEQKLVINYLNEFFEKLRLSSETHRDLKETKAYFLNWLRDQIRKNPAAVKKPNTNGGGNLK